MKAFPQRVSNEYQVEHGMDLRDYFAGQAMQAIIPIGVENSLDAKFVAKESYLLADEMMKAREQ
jgi:hypothetical protein